MKSIIKIIKSFVIMSLVVIGTLWSCDDSNDEVPERLIIESLSIYEGFFGDQVIIRGTGFSPNPTDNLVTFGGAIAEVISSTSRSITTIVPFPSSSGKVTVTTNNEEAPGPIFTLQLPPPTLVAYTSFEEVPTFIGDITYPRSGTTVMDNIQLTDPGADDPYVDFIATGDELGFDSSFVAGDVEDSTGSEPIGVFSNANMDDDGDSDFTGRFQDGTQGYLGADLDGTLEIVFDTVDLTENMVGVILEADVFYADSSSGHEESDIFEIYYMVDGQLGTALVSYAGDGDAASPNLNNWITYSVDIPINNVKPGNIVVRMKTNSNSETIYVDRVAIKAVTVN